jgi:hypothetical protein
MNKLHTSLAVWALFLFVMALVLPFTTNGSSTLADLMHSYTIYGFFSLVPIIVYGTILSICSDWITNLFFRRIPEVSLVLHMIGGAFVYAFSQHWNIALMGIFAAVLFFTLDQLFVLWHRRFSFIANVPFVLSFSSVLLMFIGASFS